MSLRISDEIDLDVFYLADSLRYLEGRREVTELVTRDVFRAFFAGCPAIGFELDGQPIGGVIFDGMQPHIAVLPQYHGRWAFLLKATMTWIFSMKPDLVVDIERSNLKALQFMARNRWKAVGGNARCVSFRLTPQGGTRKTEYPWKSTW